MALTDQTVDVFKLNHWDNAAKRSSLWDSVYYGLEEHTSMPIHHSTEIKIKSIDDIITYCINDVKSTKAIMFKSKKQIELREH